MEGVCGASIQVVTRFCTDYFFWGEEVKIFKKKIDVPNMPAVISTYRYV
jgi:hypothetical protein